MSAGEAKRLRRSDPRKVQIVDRNGRPCMLDIWRGCPDIYTSQDRRPQYMRAGPKLRPYIDYKRSTSERWAWRDYKPEPANLPLHKANEEAAGCILVEPNLKERASPNKQWHGWADLVKAPLPWVQVGPPGTRQLKGVKFIQTATIWDAVSVMRACKAAVLPEGGLHHLAAAIGLKAVVIFGEYISPKQTGYDMHRNLYSGKGEPCGWRRPCPTCAEAMRAITPERVLAELEAICSPSPS